MHQLSKQIIKLFGYAKYKVQSFDLDETDDIFYTTMLKGWEYYKPLNLWSEIIFKSRLKELLIGYQNQNKLTKENTSELIETLTNQLSQAKREVFLIFPIVGAKINGSTSFGDFTIINAGTIQLGRTEISNNQFIEEVSKYHIIDKDFWNENLNYLKSSNSPGFLEHPVMIIKETGFIYEISRFASHKLCFILQMLNIIGKAGEFKYSNTLAFNRKNVNHLLVFNSDKNVERFPLPKNFKCKFEIDFILDSKIQQYFEQSYKIYNSKHTTLKDRYLTSIRLLDSAITQSNYGTESAAMKALFLSMSLETLLNANFRGEIKSKIGDVAEKFLLENGITHEKTKESIIEVYLDRNKFIHSGQSNLEKYMPDLSGEKPKSLSLNNSIITQCLVLLEFVNYYNEFIETKELKALEQWHMKIRNYVSIKKRSFVFELINKLGYYLVKISN